MMLSPAVSSGVSRGCLVLASATLDNLKPSISRVPAVCPGCLGLDARARAYVYINPVSVFSFMREQITLSTLDTLSNKREVIVFKGVLVSRVVSRVGCFLSRVGFMGVDSD